MPVVMDDSAVGRRVVLRYRRAAQPNGAPFSDVVGELTSWSDGMATVSGRNGEVRVPVDSLVAARLVAPDRGRILQLQRIAALGWRSAEVATVDGWVLRANAGWTSRANSALPLGTPAGPLEAVLDVAADFYTDRSLPVQVLVPLPARGLLDAELARRCWQVHAPTVMLTRSLHGPDEQSVGPPVELEPDITSDWRTGYHARDGVLSAAALALLGRHETVRFATVRSNGRTLAIARGVVDEGWLGVTALEVSDAHRRQGLGSAVMRALEGWAITQGASQAYLQVEETNAAAGALYGSLGYREHHRYHYRRRPPATSTEISPVNTPPSITP
jgi:GNAT superfamily N-acetyltransferase